ncbi:polymeric immunoglobulin receptor-like isoform X1 [Tachysurus ichikawai]
MMKYLYLFSVVFYVAAGCDLSGAKHLVVINGHRGGSVLLPCSCSDLHTKPQTFTWMTYRTGHPTDVLNDEHYRDRLQLFKKSSPGNLSLLISDLREEDQGDYRCSTGSNEYRDIRINVKGCELVKEEYVENRVKLISKSSLGNLSLLISDLTELDQGYYRCSVQAEIKDFILYVKVGRRETSTRSGKTDRRTQSVQPSRKTTQEQGTCGKNGITEGRPDCKGKKTDQVSKPGAARVQINTGEKTNIITN